MIEVYSYPVKRKFAYQYETKPNNCPTQLKK